VNTELALPALRKLTITIPHLPPRELSLNARIHWTKRRKVMEETKTEIGWLAKSEWNGQPPMHRARISYLFHVKDRRIRDYDNLISMCKGYPDGLKDVGVIYRDDIFHLELGSVRTRVAPGGECTVITVEELYDDE